MQESTSLVPFGVVENEELVRKTRRMFMVFQLKVNVCSLAAESRQIRKEVDRFKRISPQKGADPTCQELIRHRRWDLRNESRAAQLLYGFVRGVAYRRIERKPDWSDGKWYDARSRLAAKARKFGVPWDDVWEWLNVVPAEVG